MPTPKSKQDLLAEITKQREMLGRAIVDIPDDLVSEQMVIGKWTVKDVLAHLASWHELFLSWFETGSKKEKPALPAVGYTWNQLRKLNHDLYISHQDKSLIEITNFYNETFRNIIALINPLSDKELFSTGAFSWTGKHSLVDFILPCTGHHYRWARYEIRKSIRQNKLAK